MKDYTSPLQILTPQAFIDIGKTQALALDRLDTGTEEMEKGKISGDAGV